jgi:uncharacterized repeat protein (TIGR01451 family)
MNHIATLLLCILVLTCPAQITLQFDNETLIGYMPSNNGYAPWVNPFLEHADIDNDGDYDVIVVRNNFGSNTHELIWLHNDAGVFTNQITVLVDFGTTNLALENIKLNDLDNDGDMDIVGIFQDTNNYQNIGWYANDGSGNFTNIDWLTTGTQSISNLHLADLDNDGLQDLVYSAPPNNYSYWMSNTGNAIFINPIALDYCCSLFTQFFDFNSDGLLDYLTTDGSWLLLYGTGNGAFENSGYYIQSNYPEISNLQSLNLADMDNDGDMDALIHAGTTHKWCENQGNGVFGTSYDPITPPIFHFIANAVYNAPYSGVHFGDVDLDNDIDVFVGVTTIQMNEYVIWYENVGSYQFIKHQIESPVNFTNISLCDLNNDGDLDLTMISFSNQFWITTRSNLELDGCMDPSACNYEASAVVDDASCCFGECGCMATDNNATCDDGSCVFTQFGYVFHDENENGIWDTNENALPGQTVIFYPANITATTNEAGMYMVSLPYELYQISVLTNENFPFVTTNNDWETTLGQFTVNTAYNFGVSSESPVYALQGDISILTTSYPCDTYTYHYLHLHNPGNQTINVTMGFEFDALFQNYFEISPIDSIVNNVYYFHENNLLPGGSATFIIGLLSPSADFLGEELSASYTAHGYANYVLVASSNTASSKILTCAYDPNHKQSEPIGITENHYILGDTEIEYLIRFQNTGNAPATNVILRDTLDSNLNISTFQLVSNSHSVITTTNPITHEVTFLFQNIMLPDSTSNEPESHGYIKYRISPFLDLQGNTEINNTAYIYFDSNEPIVTNTTWHNIYTCALFLVDFTIDENILTATLGDSYQWFKNGVAIPGATSQTYTITSNGNYNAQITGPFGCVKNTNTQSVVYIGITNESYGSISIYPNPMNEICTISFTENLSNATITVIDMNGKIMRSLNSNSSNSIQFTRDYLPAGIYALPIVGKEFKHVTMLIIN